MSNICKYTGEVETSSGERRAQRVRCPECGRLMKIATFKADEDGIRYIRRHKPKQA